MIGSKRKSRATISNYAIVELKYEEKKMFLVPIERIRDFKPTFSLVQSYFCYISADPFEEPNFNAEYLKKFDGRSGVFKVFIRKCTATVEAAMKYQKDLQNKRIPSVPQKFRGPANTDSELAIQEKIMKKKEKQIQKANQKSAETKNAAYLVDALKIAEEKENSLTLCVDQSPSSNHSLAESNKGIVNTSVNKNKNVIKKPVETKRTANKLEDNGQKNDLQEHKSTVVNNSKVGKSTNKENDAKGSIKKSVDPNKIVKKRSLNTGPDNSLKNMVKKPKVSNCTVTNGAKTLPCLLTDLTNKNSSTISNMVNGNNTSSECVVINFDDILKKLAKMEQENSDYKARNELLEEKNEALNLALIAAYKSAAKLLFKDTNEGRYYMDYKVLLTKAQLHILDAIEEDNLYLIQLLLIVFGSATLKASSVTGRMCNRTKEPAKPGLDKTKLKFVYDLMAARTNGSEDYKKTAINKIINKKIANLNAKTPQAGQLQPNHVEDNASTDFSDNDGEIESENESIGDNNDQSIDASDNDGEIDSENESEELLNLSDSVQVEGEVEDKIEGEVEDEVEDEVEGDAESDNLLNDLNDLTNIDDLVKMVELGDLSELTW